MTDSMCPKFRFSAIAAIELRFSNNQSHSPTFCCFFRRWQPAAVSASSFTCISPQWIPSTLRFIRQKKDLRAPGQSRDTPWGTSVFTGNMAKTITMTATVHQQFLHRYLPSSHRSFFLSFFYFLISIVSLRCFSFTHFSHLYRNKHLLENVAINNILNTLTIGALYSGSQQPRNPGIRLVRRLFISFPHSAWSFRNVSYLVGTLIQRCLSKKLTRANAAERLTFIR